jgi:hypothetical protein
MAIYDFSKTEKSELNTSMLTQRRLSEEEGHSAASEMNEAPQQKASRRDQIFSALAARLFFLLLVLADLLWLCYALVQMAFAVVGFLVTRGRVPYFNNLSE